MTFPQRSAVLRSLYALCAMLLCVFLSACNKSQRIQKEAYVFGTRVEIVAMGVNAEKTHTALAEVLREFDRLHRSLHAWQPSELTRLNAQLARGERAQVSAELAMLLSHAQHYDHASDGLFNSAMGALIAAWGFHGDTFRPQRPDPQTLAQLRDKLGRSTDIHIAGQTISSRNPRVQLQFDFGGLAKGYALDRAAQILQGAGIRNALINIGGNVMALGSKDGQPWQVGIQHPRQNGPIATLSLYDGEAIASSGDYQRYFELDGRRYSHLIDPRSGEPAQAAQAVSVLITPQKNAGLISDVVGKPIFLAGKDWRTMAKTLKVDHVLRIAADGHIELSSPMRARLRWSDSAGEQRTVVE